MLLVRREQGLHLHVQLLVSCAFAGEIRQPVRGRALQHGFEDTIDMLPPLPVHLIQPFANSRRRNALARPHSRVTVSRWTPSTSAISSTLRPP
jgi:hypothetical protein